MNPHMPGWLKQPVPRADELGQMERLLAKLKLHTICESGRCPNVAQCFPRGAAFLILGNRCTRNCSFCAVDRTPPLAPDETEPVNIVAAARSLGLSYIFLTSVTRDDLVDGGAKHYALTIELIRRELPGARVEVLIPDFNHSRAALETILAAHPDVLGHNLETVPRLYPDVRPMAGYRHSLNLLQLVKECYPRQMTKSGLMLGLGETRDEVLSVMEDLQGVGCDLLTLGQYLAPSARNHPVVRYVTPAEFADYKRIGLEMGFRAIASAPLWRSSFKAEELFAKAMRTSPEKPD
jgi:lipoic acid synthetase